MKNDGSVKGNFWDVRCARYTKIRRIFVDYAEWKSERRRDIIDIRKKLEKRRLFGVRPCPKWYTP